MSFVIRGAFVTKSFETVRDLPTLYLFLFKKVGEVVTWLVGLPQNESYDYFKTVDDELPDIKREKV